MTVHRIKLLAAAVLLAGGLSSVAGTGLLAGPQPPAPGAGSVPPATRPAAATPMAGRLAPAAAADPLTALGSGPTMVVPPGRRGVVENAPARRWEYDFAPASPTEAGKLVGLLRDREARGWEFVGQVTLLRDGKDAPHWAFRRPPALPPAAAGSGATTTGFTPAVRPSADPFDPAAGLPTAPAPLDRAESAGDRIRALEAELRLLREAQKEPREEVVIPAKEVGLEPGEMVTVLVKLADRRFGPDARRRLELAGDGRGLTVRGDAEAVRWARDVVKRMSDR